MSAPSVTPIELSQNSSTIVLLFNWEGLPFTRKNSDIVKAYKNGLVVNTFEGPDSFTVNTTGDNVQKYTFDYSSLLTFEYVDNAFTTLYTLSLTTPIILPHMFYGKRLATSFFSPYSSFKRELLTTDNSGNRKNGF